MTVDFPCLLDEETRPALAGLLDESGNQVDEDLKVPILLGFLR
jgi:hypothetical protein